MTQPGKLKATDLSDPELVEAGKLNAHKIGKLRGRLRPAGSSLAKVPVKSLLANPQCSLSSWTFTNTSASHIYNLKVISCWNLNKNCIINLQPTVFELSGSLPKSLKNYHNFQCWISPKTSSTARSRLKYASGCLTSSGLISPQTRSPAPSLSRSWTASS